MSWRALPTNHTDRNCVVHGWNLDEPDPRAYTVAREPQAAAVSVSGNEIVLKHRRVWRIFDIRRECPGNLVQEIQVEGAVSVADSALSETYLAAGSGRAPNHEVVLVWDRSTGHHVRTIAVPPAYYLTLSLRGSILVYVSAQDPVEPRCISPRRVPAPPCSAAVGTDTARWHLKALCRRGYAGYSRVGRPEPGPHQLQRFCIRSCHRGENFQLFMRGRVHGASL